MWDRPSGGWFRVAGRAWRPLDNGNTQDAEGFEGLLIDWRETNCFIGAASNRVQPRWLRAQRNRARARPACVGLAPENRVRGPLSWSCAREPSSWQKTRVIRRCRAARCALSGYPPPRRCVIPGERCARRFVPPRSARAATKTFRFLPSSGVSVDRGPWLGAVFRQCQSGGQLALRSDPRIADQHLYSNSSFSCHTVDSFRAIARLCKGP